MFQKNIFSLIYRNFYDIYPKLIPKLITIIQKKKNIIIGYRIKYNISCTFIIFGMNLLMGEGLEELTILKNLYSQFHKN